MTRQKLGEIKRESERVAQRCDLADEMRAAPDLPDTLLESKTGMRDGESKR